MRGCSGIEASWFWFCVKGFRRTMENICGGGGYNLARKLLGRKQVMNMSLDPKSYWNHLVANTIRAVPEDRYKCCSQPPAVQSKGNQ